MAINIIKNIARVALGGALAYAGIGHLTFVRRDFQAQVPDWVPLDKDATVIASGIVEIALGSTLIVLGQPYRALLGKLIALFFIAVFPGNIAQYVHSRSSLGLDTDRKRFVRLFFQPLLVLWAWQSTTKEN